MFLVRFAKVCAPMSHNAIPFNIEVFICWAVHIPVPAAFFCHIQFPTSIHEIYEALQQAHLGTDIRTDSATAEYTIRNTSELISEMNVSPQVKAVLCFTDQVSIMWLRSRSFA